MFMKFFKVGLSKNFCELDVDKKCLSRNGLLEMMKSPWCGHLWKNIQLEQVNYQNNIGN